MNKLITYSIYVLGIILIPLQGQQISVACVGNSITLGAETKSYPLQLQDLLGSDYGVGNYGHGSTTVIRAGENPYWNITEYIFAKALPRDIVIIMFGTNATRSINWDYHSADFIDDYLDLMNEFRRHYNNEPFFIVGLPPPILADGVYGLRNSVLRNEVIPKLRSIATTSGAKIIDFYGAFIDHPEWYLSDGIHPNTNGNAEMAKLVSNVVQGILNPVPDPPTGLKTIPKKNSIELVWDNSQNDVTNYHIYRSENISDTKTYMISLPNSRNYWTDNNVQKTKFYYYHIVSQSLLGKRSKPSKTVVGSILDDTPPIAPQDLLVSQEADSIILSWLPNPEIDVKKYFIYRNTSQSELLSFSSVIDEVEIPDTTYIDQNIASAETYYYVITAVDISGNQSGISNLKSITTKSRPTSDNTTITLYEDLTHSFTLTDFPFNDNDNHTLDKIIFIDSDHFEYFSYNNESIDTTITCDNISNLKFTPEPQEFGARYSVIEFKVIDSFGSASIDTNFVIIDLAPVNDAPHINPISDIFIMEDSHSILLPISGINTGQTNEIQNLRINAFATNENLINIPSIQYSSPETTAVITIDPVESVFGIIPMNVKVVDDGGTENNGIDSTVVQFNLHIAPINDPPIFNFIDKIVILEDTKTELVIDGIQAGPWEANQEISISVKSDNENILPTPVLNYRSPDTNAFLKFNTIPNVFGTTSVTVTIADNGGKDFGGKDSASYSIPVEIISVNDKPFDFSIISPDKDSTIVINKRNFNQSLNIQWESTTDIENDDIKYNLIFDGNLSELSRYGLTNTNMEYSLKDILSVTDTTSIAQGELSIIATDGTLETIAHNSNTTITVDGRSFAPAKLQLDQNYPNPFNSSTLIGFDLPKRGAVSLVIYDLLGEEIIRLFDSKILDRGYNTIAWNGSDKNNIPLPAGIYLMHIRTDNSEQHKKLILLK